MVKLKSAYTQEHIDRALAISVYERSITNIIKGFEIPAALPWYLVDEVLAVVELKNRVIRVYDSSIGSRKNAIPHEIKMLSKMLPSYLMNSEFFEETDNWNECVGQIVETVVLNPPFGTRRKGVDMDFPSSAMKVASQAVYSLHKTTTRESGWGREEGTLLSELDWASWGIAWLHHGCHPPILHQSICANVIFLAEDVDPNTKHGTSTMAIKLV
ncbi:hypothetical protein H5410_039299 [Solanum commersonii]|uniref:Uncharacterized protein n=1 Tax=Solanum commersonii TaxID=4109 RepID=A0A9J5YBH3_SOLCO|nr:hypothetical protein H5410_039299 [Solanum commersonii]